MVKVSLLAAAAAVVALSAPAGAACLDEVAQLSQRLNQIRSAEARQQPAAGDTVELDVAGNQDVQVPVDEGGTEPSDSWIGETPPAPAGAEQELERAREMAQAGDEQGCAAHAEQAARIIAALEDQLQQ